MKRKDRHLTQTGSRTRLPNRQWPHRRHDSSNGSYYLIHWMSIDFNWLYSTCDLAWLVICCCNDLGRLPLQATGLMNFSFLMLIAEMYVHRVFSQYSAAKITQLHVLSGSSELLRPSVINLPTLFWTPPRSDLCRTNINAIRVLASSRTPLWLLSRVVWL